MDSTTKFGQLQFRPYLLNRLLSQNPLLLVLKLLNSSFKISKNYGIIIIYFLLTWAYFLSDYSKILFCLISITYSKIIQSTQEWVRTCSNILWTFPIFFWKSGSVTANGIEWCRMTHFSCNWWETADVSKNITWKVFKRIYENNNGVIHPNRTGGSEIRAIQRLEIGR